MAQTNENPEALVVELGDKKRTVRIGPGAYKLAQLLHEDKIGDLRVLDTSLDGLINWLWIGLLPDDPDLDKVECYRWYAQLPDEKQYELLDAIGKRVARIATSYKAYMGYLLEAMGIEGGKLDEAMKAAMDSQGAEGNGARAGR